ncbi:MAG: hypothetical protein SCARUB_01758 [Candidatus Scalindua rubra]|uniref:Phage protein n=1 Tax=Candidatus Scalindua rubra TaxID=1872076 RepID=A0A1E3XDV0_9BACT|nr:MAG: hypothetical protein SCARUB_01758 [Candidatus Scalindua rubra]
MITVQTIDSTTFKVTVEKGTTTTHTVTVTPSYYERLTDKLVKPEELVEKSFEFLLEREGNTSILRSFNLSVISQYFPEYERTIKDMLK